MKKWLATAGTTLLALTLSTTAFAHSHLSGSMPADGDIVTEPLNEITLNFDGKIEQGSYFDVEQADGGAIPVEDFIIGEGTLTGTFAEALPNEDYTVNWRIISADGHPLEGTFSFQVNVETFTEAPQAEETPPPTTNQSTEPTGEEQKQSSSNLGIIAAIVLAIIAAAIVLARRKK